MFKIRVRVIVGIMIFLGYFLLYIVRYNLSVHIVDMAQLIRKNTSLYGGIITRATILRSRSRSGVVIINLDDFKMAQLFSAYHIGFCVCFPIFHNVGDRLGPTWVVGIAGIISGILNCLTPPATYQNFWLLFVVRIITGFCAGAMQPSMVQLLRHWVPPIERNHFMWAYCGITTGTLFTFLFCAAVHYYARWHIGFYSTGVVQIIWAAAWIVIITDYPEKHPCIPQDELIYLRNTIGDIFTIKLTNSQAPWNMIVRSVPFWTLCALNFGYAWIIIALCLHGPIFYTGVIGYSIYTASVLTAVPFILRLVLGTVLIQTLHWYKHNSEVSRIQHLRKYFILVSHVIPGLLVTSSWLMPVIPGPVLLTTAVALTAAGMDLTLAICYELSPNYANSINTVIKIIGNLAGIIVPFSVGAVTYQYKSTPYVWKHIWCFHALILLVSGVIFLIWGDSSIQPWNSVRHRYIRPAHPRPIAKPSIMSNITEVDEEDSSRPLSQIKRNSFLSKGFKISQSRV